MENEYVNLEDISKLQESEFKENFEEWLENDGVARSLQAKLRKDLFDTFNRTQLGRKLLSQHQKTTKIVLSPLVLVLDTLVSEFLYAHDCHFALSVFCTEAPHPSTIPHFETLPQFRFNSADLEDIFEAISHDINPNFKEVVKEQYLSDPDNSKPSLLYLILKHAFNTSDKIEQTTKERNIKDENIEKNSKSASSKSRKYNYYALYNEHFRYLDKYLIILSRKVRNISQNLEHVQQKNIDSSNAKKTVQMRNLECLNRNLHKISDHLKQLSLSKRKTRTIATIMTAVDKISCYFEKCTANYEIIAKHITQRKLETNQNDSEKYSIWFENLKATKNGRKLLSKVESTLKKTVEREKRKMQEVFEAQLKNEKELIKVKYKQKTLEILSKQSSKEECNRKSKSNELIEEEMKVLAEKSEQILSKLSENDRQIRAPPESFCIRNELTSNPDGEYGKSCKERLNDAPVSAKGRARNYEQDIIRYDEVIDRVKPQLEEITRTISQHECSIYNIVSGAKLRMQQLDGDCNQVEQNFQSFLKRQTNGKTHAEGNVDASVVHYKLDKSILDRKCSFIGSPRYVTSFQCTDGPQSKDVVVNIPIQRPAVKTEEMGHVLARETFENPFRKIQNDTLVSNGVILKDSNPEIASSEERKDDVLRTIELNLPELQSKTQNAGDDEHHAQSLETKLTNITLDSVEVSPTKTASESRGVEDF